MAEEIKGTNISAPVVPFTEDDIYATHEARFGKGGFRSVQTIKDRDKIPEPRLEEGMMVFVKEDPSGVHTYQYLSGKWVKSRVGPGIPIYNQDLIDELGINPDTDSYISIPNKSELDKGEIEQKTYRTSINGGYVDVLFKAIRSLQSEVARLKNSFSYGIESRTGRDTAMSAVVDELYEDVEDEPLWSIMEGSMPKISDISLNSNHQLTAPTGTVISPVVKEDGTIYLEIAGPDACWDIKRTTNITRDTNSKLFLYSTTRGRNIKFVLDVYSDVTPYGTINSERYQRVLDLTKLDIPVLPESGFYNVLVALSRSQRMSDNNYYGRNFIWVSVGDPASDTTLCEGYWNQEDNTLSPNIIELEKDYRYNFSKIYFSDLSLNKLDVYSKWQDFSDKVLPSKPSDNTYKFKAAHITIRAVDDQKTLVAIKDQLLNNELIFVESTGRLWIKSNNKLTTIAGGGSSDTPGGEEGDGMTREELVAALKDMGIVQETNGDLTISNLAVEEIKFIHQASGKRFIFEIDSDGNLCNREIPDEATKFENITKNLQYVNEDVRGFVGATRLALSGATSRAVDAKLNSDRIRIGSFYAPFSSDLIHGCSHSYIELENTSDVDTNLEGCYLHITKPIQQGIQGVFHLPLTGVIPAGGTYLIRGAKHAELNDPNVYLKIRTCDQEWWCEKSVGKPELMSFEINENIDVTASASMGYGFALTYGNDFGGTELDSRYSLVRSSISGDTVERVNNIDALTIGDSERSTYPLLVNKNLIDSLYYHKMVVDASGVGYWAPIAISMTSNSIYRNTFELDPAKQAFQSFNHRDSSRARWENISDIQIVDLSNEYISFPHTSDTFEVANYTPRASFEKKNVCTGKSKLDPEKPNMVFCSFGTDIYKTRCFNWVSTGYYPEYVWIRKSGTNTWENAQKVQSYLPIQEIKISDYDYESDATGVTKIDFTVTTSGWVPGTDLSKYSVLVDSDRVIISRNVKFIYTPGKGYTATISGNVANSLNVDDKFYLCQDGDEFNKKVSATSGSNIKRTGRKSFSADITNNVYARMTGRFPADGSFYTAHKAVIDIKTTPAVNENDTNEFGNLSTSTQKFDYVVGRADRNGLPDMNHCSDVMHFTLYKKKNGVPTRVYQITDQQGFRWMEYQVWAALAKQLKSRIDSDCATNSIIPILINTGDVTQNGSRLNEWLDYYEAGKELFKEYEHMSVVGNNDLCGSDPSLLGTGDDSGKSSPYYFHLFNCYEVGGTLRTHLIDGKFKTEVFEPLIYPTDKTKSPKYIPSFYYFDSDTDRFLMINSEITETTCKNWFGAISNGGKTINVYTGYEIESESPLNRTYQSDMTSIYTMIWRILKDAKGEQEDGGALKTEKKVLVACHEGPFTVITNSALQTSEIKQFRSISSGNLVGSHLNQISKYENTTSGNSVFPGIYWFSRLMEFFNVELVICGHKHTYSCTYPIKENYMYEDSDKTVKSSKDGNMAMGETLEEDPVWFINSDRNLSKFPLLEGTGNTSTIPNLFLPCEFLGDNKFKGSKGVVYFMCQASGYKLTSNKELPSAQQRFSMVVPQTVSTGSKDVASDEQKYPMYSVINFNSGNFDIKLVRVRNILKDFKFTQYLFGTDTMTTQTLAATPGSSMGHWGDEDVILYTNTTN